jgi:hypothetical protein
VARQSNRLGKDEGAAVGEIVAVNRGHDRVLQAQARDRLGDSRRFGRIQFVRPAVGHGAICASPRTYIAEDHERRRTVMPALTDVGAVRVLAHGVEFEIAHDSLEPDVVVRSRGTNFQPGGLGFPGADKLQGRFDGHLVGSGLSALVSGLSSF